MYPRRSQPEPPRCGCGSRGFRGNTVCPVPSTARSGPPARSCMTATASVATVERNLAWRIGSKGRPHYMISDTPKAAIAAGSKAKVRPDTSVKLVAGKRRPRLRNRIQARKAAPRVFFGKVANIAHLRQGRFYRPGTKRRCDQGAGYGNGANGQTNCGGFPFDTGHMARFAADRRRSRKDLVRTPTAACDPPLTETRQAGMTRPC